MGYCLTMRFCSALLDRDLKDATVKEEFNASAAFTYREIGTDYSLICWTILKIFKS